MLVDHDGRSRRLVGQFSVSCMWRMSLREEGRITEMLSTTLVICYSGIGEEEGVGFEVVRWQMHSLVLRLKVLALVHGQATSSATETVALRAEFAAVADFAK